MLLFAAVLLFICGLVHSILGEKYILRRLFKRDNLPQLFGSDHFTKGTLRFAWHITTFAWFGFATILLSYSQLISINILSVVASVFLVSALCSAYFTKGKHLSWLVFSLVSLLCFLSR